MSNEMIIVFGLIFAAMLLFGMDRFPFDLVAMLIMITLMALGILTVREGLSGLSSPATVTIAAMFVLSEGIRKTGVLQVVSRHIARLDSFPLPVVALILMVVIALMSAFINNTAAVVIFIPVLISAAAHMNVSPSKLLMPLSFASMFGGVCTLLGTSTNILVSTIAVDNGLPAFTMFEFAPFGLILALAGFIYFYFVGIHLVPVRRSVPTIAEDDNSVDYMINIHLQDDFSEYGQSPLELAEIWGLDIEVSAVWRNDHQLDNLDEVSLQRFDIIRLNGSAQIIERLIHRQDGFNFSTPAGFKKIDGDTDRSVLLEAVVAPDSDYRDTRIVKMGFDEKFKAHIIGFHQREEIDAESLSDISIRGGDSLLVSLPKKNVDELMSDANFIIVSDVDTEDFEPKRTPLAIAILSGVVISAALGLAPIVVTACLGVIIMIITRCLETSEIYKAVDWKVIFLLAGVIPLGIAMQKTGAARLLSDLIVDTLGNFGPRAVLSGYFLLTILLTAMISNQATAAILASLAIETAGIMKVEVRPFLMAITFGASLSFITPWGYQTNAMIMKPGCYRVIDFLKVGAPLNILFWILATLLIPYFWPFF